MPECTLKDALVWIDAQKTLPFEGKTGFLGESIKTPA